MTESDNESKLDELERDSLLKAISEVETAKSVSTPGTRSVFENFLQNAKGRVAALEKNIQQSKAEHEARKQAEVAIAALAEKEAALSAAEKQTYSGFLTKEFFTKQDFGSLEKFYAQTWDRLSESGKDEMSHRVWEGIRKGQYTFKELPAKVREKETEWAYTTLVKREYSPACTGEIPKKDRDDFIRAYESGRKEECQEVLGRESFKQNMFRGAESKGVKQARVETGRAAAGDAVQQNASLDGPESAKTAEVKSGGKSEIDLSGFNLQGVKLSDAPREISSTDIKTAIASMAKNSASLVRS